MGDDRGAMRASSPGGARNTALRTAAQLRAFLELARVVAAGEQGLWSGALPLLLAPAASPWGMVYRLHGTTLEMSTSEGLPLALRVHVNALDLTKHGACAVCRAVRTRRAVTEERLFASAVDARELSLLEGAGILAGTAVPIVHGSTVYGVLVVGVSSREPLEADTAQFLDAVASLLAPALAFADTGKHPASVDRRSSNPPHVTGAPARNSVDVGRAAVEAVQQCASFLRRAGIDMRLAADEGHMALGDRSDVGLAIAHLVTNAAEAAAERSPIASAPTHPRRVRVAVIREGTTVVVSVEDSGRGVPPDLRARVFEAGFSTKGKGRGQGLYNVRQIALNLGGHVEIGSSELGGASFRLVLPMTAAHPEPSASGLWHTGATWPQMRAAGRDGRGGDAGGSGGEGADDDPPVRRSAASG